MTTNNTEGTPLVPEDMEDWSDVPLSIPSAAQVAEEDEKKDDDKQDEEDTTATPPAPEPEDDIEVEYLEDPGDFQPSDNSFEVTVFDEDGNNPKTQKISSVEDWEKLMESSPNLGSTAATDKALRLVNKMENNLEREKSEWQTKKDKFESVKQDEENQAKQVNTWTNELDYLISRGDLPAVDKEYVGANWDDPEVAKQDGVKEQIELFAFMRKENAARTKANLAPLTSMLDVFNAFKAQNSDKIDTKTDDKPKVKEATVADRKKAGARVAGASVNPVGANVPKGVSVGRGGSLDDLGRGWDDF